MSHVMNHRSLAAAACLLALASGCAQTSLFKGSAKIETATPKEPAVKLLCIWEAARGRGPNGMPTRGMAGQLMFFTPSNPSPVAVEGDVRIYLFDNLGTPQEQARPIHQFDFTSESWQAHLRNGNLGPSYHVFVPYVRGGFEQVECSLQVRFTPKEGPVVYSEMTSVVLPGTTDQSDESQGSLAAREPDSAAKGALDESPRSQPNKASLAVHTIRPQDLGRRSVASPPASRSIVDTSIQQASATAGRSPSSVEQERLERLEQMMTRLLERESTETQARRPRRGSATHPLLDTAAPAPRHPLSEAAFSEPDEVSEETTHRRRFRLQAARAAAPAPAPADYTDSMPRTWKAEPAPQASPALYTGTGTSYYPDWLPADDVSSQEPSTPWE